MKHFLSFLILFSGTAAICTIRRQYYGREHSRAVSTMTKQPTLSPGIALSDAVWMKCISACTKQSCPAVNLFSNGTCEYVLSTSYTVIPDEGCQLYLDKPFECPAGFDHLFSGGTPSKGGLYKPSCYLYLPDELNWQTARDRCKIHGGDLASIESSQEKTHIIQSTSSLGIPDTTYFWIAGSDSNMEGVWQWKATGAAIGYFDWIPGEPNNAANEDCLVMKITTGQSWNDESCEDIHSSLCEASAITLKLN